MESEAKDSEDEMPDHDTKLIRGSPHNLQQKSPVHQSTPLTAGRLPNAEPVGSSTVVRAKDVTPSIKLEKGSDQAKKSISRISQLEPKSMDDGKIDGPKPSSLLNLNDAVSLSTGVDTDPPTSSTSAKRLSDANASKLSASSHAKKTSRRSTLSLHQGVVSGNNTTPNDRLTEGKKCPSLHDLENGISANVSHEIPSSRRKLPEEGGPNCSPSLKRKMIDSADFSPPRLKFQKSNGSCRKQDAAEETVVSVNGSCEMTEHTLEDPCALPVMDASVTPNHPSQNAPHSPEKRSSATKHPISRNLTSDLANGSGRSSSSPFAAPSPGKGKEEQQNQQRLVSPPVKDIKAVKCGSPILNAIPALDTSTPKSTRKSSSGKILGSRPKLNAGSSAKQKGSIHLIRISSGKNASVLSEPEIGASGHPAIVNDHTDTAAALPTNDCSELENQSDANPQLVDDETEPPVEVDNLRNAAAEDDETLAREIQHEVEVCNDKPTEDASVGQGGPRKHELAKRKKPVLARSEKSSTMGNVLEPKTPIESENNEVGKVGKNIKNPITKRSKLLQPLSDTKHLVLMKKLQESPSSEKENQPVIEEEELATENRQNTPPNGSTDNGKSTARAKQTLKRCTQKVANVTSRPSRNLQGLGSTEDRAWFILSGHRFQRKEFQKVIKKLKGRLCRDSHQWSYQATHFIGPEPIRRTEKFFAAAASGCWVLKTDYLAASTEAGKLLPEEPYEWHENGLTRDGTINLEAPRKWRLLKGRTGHGAFHGMRIIIYGDCIAPSLDTLKRVIKAGDGRILATSPPYTRFLNSEVDFAIVCPGMPRVDLWVQEFLRHEIPCVLADYLVEYVCKPGFSLEKHVQYNTQAWAARSLAKLVNRSEEILESPATSDDQVNNKDDVACLVCGSVDRGEVMLICGNESGTVGCGTGTHIDCCDPPLYKVPEED
ncbi:BRCT domain-containing protein, partial [Drosera capensis]